MEFDEESESRGSHNASMEYDDYRQQLTDKILEERRSQCHLLTAAFQANDTDQIYCPPVFDGWSCWNATPAGGVAFTSCPYFITGFDPQRMAHKLCTDDGIWFRHPKSNLTWSNYTTCIDVEDLQMRQRINSVYIAGYAVSLIALVISLAILCFFHRSLKCTRIYIHRNLFASFIVNNAMWVIWYKGVADQPEVLLENGLGCKVLHVLLHYFMVSNYFWMFCEGLYLHTLLVVAFLPENSLMKWFHLIGWVVPAIFTVIYAGVRASIPEETIHCWIEESWSTWFLSGPVCFSMLANAIFLVNIVRVLVTKLRAPSSNMGGTSHQPLNPIRRASRTTSPAHQMAEDGNEDGAYNGNGPVTRQTYQEPARLTTGAAATSRSTPSLNGLRKAVRATFILVPLLGLHYVVMPFRPEPGSAGEIAYQIVSAVFTSFQGLCVAFLFCFCNGEVLQVLRKEFVRYAVARQPGLTRRLSTRSQPMTTEL